MTHSFTRFPLLLLLRWQLHYDYWILHWRNFVIRLLHVWVFVYICMWWRSNKHSRAKLSQLFGCCCYCFCSCLSLSVALPNSIKVESLSAFKSESWRAFKPLRSCLCPSFSLNVMVVLLLLLLLLLLCFFVLYDWPTDWPSRRYSSIAAPAKTGLATNIASAVHLCVVCVCVCMCAIVSINRDFMRSLHSRAQRSADIAAVANLSVHMYVYR